MNISDGAVAPSSVDEAELEAIFQSFENRRKPRVILFCVGLLVSIALAGFLFSRSTDANIIIIVVVGGGILSYAPIHMLQNEFKDELVPRILAQYGFSYDRKAHRLRIKDYEDILPSYTSATRSDHFWGTHEDIKMSVAELKLRRKSGKNTVTVFNGLLCRFDYPKRAKAEVAVKSDGGAIGQFFSGIFSSGKRVKLEDPVFEGRFDVYSSDQVAARYILTPTVMERLVALEREHRGLRAIFRRDEVLLAIPNGPDLFHPGSFFSSLDYGIVRRFHRDMTGVFEFVDALKLDARSKI